MRWYTGRVKEYKRHPNTTCKICDKAIYRRPSEIELNRGNVFCSNACYGKSTRNEHPCVICGSLILASAHKKTCSRACANKNRAGIKYKQGRPKDKVKNYLSLKRRLKNARGENCERCGYDVFQILQVHHVDRDRENNELKNLELLCPNCHAEEHYLKK